MPEGTATALLGEAALFVLLVGHECNSSVVPSDFDRLVSGYKQSY